jgi:hypothetical protein
VFYLYHEGQGKFYLHHCWFLCWLHSVGQNHFYVMLLLSQGCCFIQSLLFYYVLQEDFVKFSMKFISVPYQPSERRGILSGRSSVSNICPNDVVFRPDAHQLATSIRTTRSFCSDTHQCLEASNSSRLHPSGRYSEFEKNPVFQCIRPDYVVIPSGRHSVFDKP